MTVRAYAYYESGITFAVIKDPELWDRYEYFLDCKLVEYDFLEFDPNEIDIDDRLLSKDLTEMGY